MAVEFTFGQVEAVCAAMQDISSDKRTAFTSRLKHLMNPGVGKQGILDREDARPGRGKAAKFSFSQLMKIVIGVEMLQAGTPPALAARLVAGNWLMLRVGVHFALHNEVEKRAAGDPREETYWILSPEALRDLSSAGEGRYDHYEAFQSVYRPEDLLKHFTDHEGVGIRGHYRRQLVLNGTAITRAAAFLITNEMNIASIQDLQRDIYEEIVQDQKAIAEAMDSLGMSDPLKYEPSPALKEFNERWSARVEKVISVLSPSQVEVLSADQGSDVEIQRDDLVALRTLDVLGIEQGDLVLTDLGQEVAAELRKRAGRPDPSTERLIEATKRAVDLVQRTAHPRADAPDPNAEKE